MSAQCLAEQTYRASDVARLLQIPIARLRQLQALGEWPAPSIIVPGGGRLAERWTASDIAIATAKWNPRGIETR